MNILIAPNAFKNSLAADKVAEAISKGFLQSRLECNTICFPVGDGGDGTAKLLIDHLQGTLIKTIVHDPLNRKINSSFGLVENGQTAVIELADASGLRLLEPGEYDPLHTTTYGTGELIKTALDKNVKKIILCIGGSATVDGGTGILQALGVTFLDDQGNELKNLPILLDKLADIDVNKLDHRLSKMELTILCDVENYLLGEKGAAAVFGPQKGASHETVQYLDKLLTRFRDIMFIKTGKDMATIKQGGAAGGVSAGLHTFLNAELVNGIEWFLDATGFDNALHNADLVVTGEGSIDEQTLQGKGPFGVARRARQQGLPVIGLAGKIPPEENEYLKKYFDEILSINHGQLDLQIAMKNTYNNLIKTAEAIGNRWRK